MTDRHRTQYTDDALIAEEGLQPEEVREFIRRRVQNTVEVGGLTIYNFNNHVVDEIALREQADDLRRDEYLIPHQADGIWGYMVSVLPPWLKEMEILAWDQRQGMYHAYPNLIRHSDEEENYKLTIELSEYE